MSKITYAQLAEEATPDHRPISVRLSRVHSRDGEHFALTVHDEASGVEVVRAVLSPQDIGTLITGSSVPGEAQFKVHNMGRVREHLETQMPLPFAVYYYQCNTERRRELLELRRAWVAEHHPGWTADEYEPTGRNKTLPATIDHPNGGLRIPIFRWVPEPEGHVSAVRDRVKKSMEHQ